MTRTPGCKAFGRGANRIDSGNRGGKDAEYALRTFFMRQCFRCSRIRQNSGCFPDPNSGEFGYGARVLTARIEERGKKDAEQVPRPFCCAIVLHVAEFARIRAVFQTRILANSATPPGFRPGNAPTQREWTL